MPLTYHFILPICYSFTGLIILMGPVAGFEGQLATALTSAKALQLGRE